MTPGTSFWLLLRYLRAGALVLTLLPCMAVGQTIGTTRGASAAAAQIGDDAGKHNALRRLAETANRERAGFVLRYEFELGAGRDRLAQAPCATPQPYLLPGARLWGRSLVGWQCPGEPNWKLLLPVLVRAYGKGLVSAHALQAEHAVSTDDVRRAEVDLARELPGVLHDLDAVAGRVLAHTLQQGAVLRKEHFKAPVVIASGDPVRVVYAGNGFSISTSARSLQSGAAGQTVRVQLDSGRVVAGIATADRQVEIRF